MYVQAAIKQNILLRNGAYGIVMRGVQKCTCAGASLRGRNSAPLCCIKLDTATDRASGCGGIMEPVAVWVRKGGEWAIVHRCRRCGVLHSNRIAADDNPMKLMSIAMKPLCAPPFPLERIEEMTAMMGGDGEMP